MNKEITQPGKSSNVAPPIMTPNAGKEATRPVSAFWYSSKRFVVRRIAVWAGWLILAVLVFGAWQWIGTASRVNSLFFSYPSAIYAALIEAIRGDLITSDAYYTVSCTVVGFIAAAVSGIGVAFGLSQSEYLFNVFRPVFTALNSLPRVALAPLFIMWFGIGWTSHVMIASSLSVFVIFGNTMAGIESVEQDHLLLAKLQGATKWQTFTKFIIPSAFPSIFVGLELGFIFGMLGTVAGEMIMGEHGFGVRLQRDAGMFNTKGYFATLFVMVVVTAGIASLFQVAKRHLLRWQTVHILRR